MLGSDPSFSASWMHAASLQAGFPPEAYVPPRGPAHHWSRTARDGFRSRSAVIERVPTAQQSSAVDRPNAGSCPGADQQLRSLIADAMRQLPFEHRAVIYRAYYQGWTTARIADDLEITEAAVRSRLHDGLHALRLTFHRIGQLREAN